MANETKGFYEFKFFVHTKKHKYESEWIINNEEYWDSMTEEERGELLDGKVEELASQHNITYGWESRYGN